MSERYNPQQPNYSLDDILAEFGSSPSPSAPPQPVEEAPTVVTPIPQDPEKVEAIFQLKERLEVRPQTKTQGESKPRDRVEPRSTRSQQGETPPTTQIQKETPPTTQGRGETPPATDTQPPQAQPDAQDEPKAKVVLFPEQEKKQPSQPQQPPTPGPEPVEFHHTGAKPSATAPTDPETWEPASMPVIQPTSLLRNLAARLSTLQRRADHFADHMYDQAEPDQETVKVETYLPGVDEEAPVAPPKKKKPQRPKPARVRPSKPLPPDTAPSELAARYQKGLKARRNRFTISLLLSILSILVSVPLPVDISVSLPGISLVQLKTWVLAGLLAMVGILCMEVLWVGLSKLFRFRPRTESLLALAWLFSMADALTFGIWPQRGEALPCCAVTTLGLTFAMWGRYLRQQGDRLSAKAAAQTSAPYVVSMDEDKWNHRPAYCKWAGRPKGFGSQLQMEDGAQRAYSVASPILLVVCVAFSLLASVGQQAPERFIWAAAASFTAAASYTAMLAYALPYKKLATRLYKAGAAIAGWTGIQRCRHGGIAITDSDLFPPGCIQVPHFELYGNAKKEKAVSYAATLLKEANCGLTQPFYKLLQSTGALYREATGVRFHEGGITGIIHNHDIIVGTSDFMHLVDIPLPRSLKVKHAIFCAVDGQLAAMFPVTYSMPSTVRPSLSTLIGLQVTPILATRDPNLIPALLERKFKLPVDRMEFPSTDRRRQLSSTIQEHSNQPVALLSREGVGVFCETVVGCRRLRWATRLSLGFALAGSILGVLLTFFLTYTGSYAALSPVNFLVFMLAWVVPQLLIAGWVNQY